MTSMNPMLRNTPTVSERIKMNNSGYSLGTVRSLQDQQTMKMRMGAGSSVAANNIFGNQLKNAQLDLMAARAAGSKSGEQQAIDQGKWLVPMAMRERIVSMNSLENTVGMEPEQREAILRSPRPEPGTWKARMKSQPSQPDPFSGGYKPKGEGDPYGPLPPRPKGFAMGGTMGVIPSLADSIRMTGNKISAINQGLAPDNALLMGKQYWQGLDQELAQQRSQGFAEGGTVSNVPKMDSLDSVNRKNKLPNGDDTNSRSSSANSGFDQWWQEMQKRELESEIAKRIIGHQQMEKDMGLAPLSERMAGYPKTILEDARAGFDQGVTQIGKTAAALGSYIPGSVGENAEKRRQLYDERGKIIADYRARSPVNKASFITPGGLVNKAVTMIPEVFNPVNKPGMAARGINAAWHAARGYLPDKSMKDAAISSLSSVIGEKTEDLVTQGKGLVGNTIGALAENAIQYITAPPSRPRQVPGFSMGGTLDGPGGPTDDMIPAVVDGVEPVRLSDGEEIVDAKTRDFFGKKFFLDLKKKAMKGELEGMQMQKPQDDKFAQGGTVRDRGMFDGPISAQGSIDESLANAMRAQDVAANAWMNASPADIATARRESSVAMYDVNQGLGQFFANEQAKTEQGYRDIAATRARQEAMMQYEPGSPAPRVVSTEPLPTGGSAPPIFQGLRTNQPAQPLTPAPVMAQPAPPAAEDVRFNGLAARAALDAQKPAFRPAPSTMTEKERAGMTRPSKTPMASPEMEAALTGLSGMAKRQARRQFQAEQATFNRDDKRAQTVEQRQATQQDARQDVTRAKDFTDWLQKDEIRNQRDMEAENRLLANRQAMTKEERAYQEGLAKQDTKEKEERARNFVQIPDTKYKVNGLGSVVGMDGKPVSLTPEEATKLGLVVKGADSKGNLTYSAAKPKVKMQRFYDPMNGKIVELAADEMAPEGSGWKPIQKQGAAPAANATAPTSGNITKEAYAKLKPGDTYIWNGETKTKR